MEHTPKLKKQHLSIYDIYCLWLLSLRTRWWYPNSKGNLNRSLYARLFRHNTKFLVVLILFGLVSIVMDVKQGRWGRFLVSVCYTALFTFAFCDFDRLWYNLRFTRHDWWKNTGITPHEIRNDVGLYGEYMATFAAEASLSEGAIYGRVYNNVILPKRDGDYTEIDVLSVNETGIHVIEAKARSGAFYGSVVGNEWQQQIGAQVNSMQNPVIQNLHHCNYLAEYLYEKLPKNALHGKNLSDLIFNIITFAGRGIDLSNVQLTPFPVNCFIGMAIRPDLPQRLFGKTPLGALERFTDQYAGAGEARLDHTAAGYQDEDFEERYGRRLTVDEINAICAVLDALPQYSREQRDAMAFQRNSMYAMGKFKHEHTCYEVNLLVPGQGKQTTLCDDNGYYRTYRDWNDGLFRAIPEAVIQS